MFKSYGKHKFLKNVHVVPFIHNKHEQRSLVETA